MHRHFAAGAKQSRHHGLAQQTGSDEADNVGHELNSTSRLGDINASNEVKSETHGPVHPLATQTT